jgi:hypothetical protein
MGHEISSCEHEVSAADVIFIHSSWYFRLGFGSAPILRVTLASHYLPCNHFGLA